MNHPEYGIKPLTTTRIPASHIMMAARAKLTGGGGQYRETWRVASAHFQTGVDDDGPFFYNRVFWKPEALWDEISSHAKSRGLTFLWAHNLSWTARVTNLLGHMPPRGWRLDALSLNQGASWMVFRRKEATLKIVDLQSIWPTSLDRIGQMFGLGSGAPVRNDSPDATWLSAITTDRRIMEVATLSYLDWIRTEELGSLAVTGNAQAFTAFRRRFMTDGILVHKDETLYEYERRAMWTGRAEAYWHGSLLRQVVDEWDFSSAYTQIARTTPVPVFPQGELARDALLEFWASHPTEAILAEVEVETDVPCVPVEVGGQILWPTGTFHTVLWTPEIRVALDQSRSVRLLRGWRYRRATALQAWATWLTAQLRADDVTVPAWRKDILKRWGNVLIGRFGMRYPEWSKIGRSDRSDVYMAPGWDLDSGEEWSLMQVGHEMWLQTGTKTPRYSAPMVTGYVMSAMRAKLWHLMKALPDKALLYVDTDSVLVIDQWRREMSRLAREPQFEGLRLKRSWEGMAIYGPRQIVTGDSVRIAGVPKSARRDGRHDFSGEVVESFEQAIATRSTDAVRSTSKRWHVAGTDPRRLSNGYGWTWPHHIET